MSEWQRSRMLVRTALSISVVEVSVAIARLRSAVASTITSASERWPV